MKKFTARKTIVACQLFLVVLGIPFADAWAGNMDQSCTCFYDTNGAHDAAPINAFVRAQLNCNCLNGSFQIIEPATCPPGLIQVGGLIKRNCTPVRSSLRPGSNPVEEFQGLHEEPGSGWSARVSCEIVRVCTTATGN